MTCKKIKINVCFENNYFLSCLLAPRLVLIAYARLDLTAYFKSVNLK